MRIRTFNPDAIPDLPASTNQVNWQDHTGPLDLEIGGGAGLFCVRYALANPSRRLITIERTHRFFLLERRVSRHRISNVIAIRGDAVHWVAKQAPEAIFSRAFILYPNPYPKMKHRNLRWPNMPFMGFLKKRLRPGGTLTLATNELFYREEAIAMLTQAWGFQLISDSPIDPNSEPRTHFEKKYLSRGETCWNLEFKVSST